MSELDDLLNDLQMVVATQPDPRSSTASYSHLPELPGTEKTKTPFDVPPGYDAPALSDEENNFDDDAYSTVRHEPRYVPKSRKQESPDDPPPPPKPIRTDRPEYDSTAAFRKTDNSGSGQKPALTGGGGGGAGLEELDALLSMLGSTSSTNGGIGQQDNVNNSSGSRPTVAEFVNELTEIEERVSSPSQPSSTARTGGKKDGGGTRGITASTATQELDELMGQLSDFKMPQQKDPAPATTTKPSREVKTRSQAETDLTSMLGSLQSNMHKRGVDTSSKGICRACEKPILGKVITALNASWHPEHFTCSQPQCELELASITFYEHDGKAYCEKDYHELFAPRCGYCNGPILDRCMRALGKTWHPEHFFCTLCGKHFGNEGFHEKDGRAFCRECYYEKFAPRCKRCSKAILEGFISALGSQWHTDCFCCKICSLTFPKGDYFDFEGEPYCELHYHAQRGSLCAQCQKPVTGKCVSAMGKKFHPDHFTCAFCLKLLNKGTFKEHRSNAYCQPCYIKLFG